MGYFVNESGWGRVWWEEMLNVYKMCNDCVCID